MKRVTIYDVAKEANVSLATVSRVINGSDVVKLQTKQRVDEAIKKLGYKPNAKRLRPSVLSSLKLALPIQA